MNKRYDKGVKVVVLTPEMEENGITTRQIGRIDGVFVECGILTQTRVFRVQVNGHHVYAYACHIAISKS